jgi:hypothetical protein
MYTLVRGIGTAEFGPVNMLLCDFWNFKSGSWWKRKIVTVGSTICKLCSTTTADMWRRSGFWLDISSQQPKGMGVWVA